MADEPKAPNSPQNPKPEAASPAPPGAAPRSDASSAEPKAVPPKPPSTTAKPAPLLQKPWESELSRRYRTRFGASILDAVEDRRQPYLVIHAAHLHDIALYSRDEGKFDLLEDWTAVDWPRREKRFDLIAILYSFPNNTRLRLKIPLADGQEAASLTDVWPVANWLEREIFDLFGIIFRGHPDLKRILLPDEWQGHPLRKDYDILKQDDFWVRENLGIDSGQ